MPEFSNSKRVSTKVGILPSGILSPTPTLPSQVLSIQFDWRPSSVYHTQQWAFIYECP